MAAQLSVLIASVLTKPEIVQRRVSALVGAVVADAASQHLQWIYNQVWTLIQFISNLKVP